MRKLINILRHSFRVSYRLSVLYTGETEMRHTTNRNGKELRRMARNTEDICDFWTLYKQGPFWLPEREVDCYMKGDRP